MVHQEQWLRTAACDPLPRGADSATESDVQRHDETTYEDENAG